MVADFVEAVRDREASRRRKPDTSLLFIILASALAPPGQLTRKSEFCPLVRAVSRVGREKVRSPLGRTWHAWSRILADWCSEA